MPRRSPAIPVQRPIAAGGGCRAARRPRGNGTAPAGNLRLLQQNVARQHAAENRERAGRATPDRSASRTGRPEFPIPEHAHQALVNGVIEKEPVCGQRVPGRQDHTVGDFRVVNDRPSAAGTPHDGAASAGLMFAGDPRMLESNPTRASAPASGRIAMPAAARRRHSRRISSTAIFHAGAGGSTRRRQALPLHSCIIPRFFVLRLSSAFLPAQNGMLRSEDFIGTAHQSRVRRTRATGRLIPQ